MFPPDQYQLVDFGSGFKVERFGGVTVARTSPAIPRVSLQQPLSEHGADLLFQGPEKKDAQWQGAVGESWTVQHDSLTFILRPTPAGQVGMFPEQACNWSWIAENAAAVSGKKAINLFAYTGGTTCALAAAGASVTHVDSAAGVVNWARQNAYLSGLQKKPIRWVVEDAMKFVRREIKRGNQYEIFVADPPSFGRGRKKETWQIDRDLPTLIDLASQLCPKPIMLILSCHSPDWSAQRLAAKFRGSFPAFQNLVRKESLDLQTSDGRKLNAGYCARAIGKSR